MIFPFFKPGSTIDWSTVEGQYDWFDKLKGCLQDDIFHAEGDALVHTKWVTDELFKDTEFLNLSETDQHIAVATAVLHDVAKPATSYLDENGRWKTKNHCLIGSLMARKILYLMGVPFAKREKICASIRFHLKPFFLIDYDNPLRLALQIAASCRLDLLKIQANADLRGRICPDAQKILDNIELYAQYCKDEGLYENPLPFANPHSRFLFFKDREMQRPYDAFLDKRCDVIVLSGLPGSGKDRWISKHGPDWPVVSLDAIRRARKIKPTDEQGEVIFAAYDQAKEHLRKKQNFVWNATNISRQIRSEVTDRLSAYNAYIKLVYVESSHESRMKQNADREHVVPEAVIERLMHKWEVPDLTEAHEVEYFVE